jgi:hypothetical protein
MHPLTDGSSFARRALAGDLTGLVVFLVIGIERHAENLAGRFVSLTVIFLGTWLVTAWVVGTYRPATSSRLLLTLVLAVPLAVAVRAVTVSRWSTGEVLTFMLVALAFCAAFIGGIRLALVFAQRRST